MSDGALNNEKIKTEESNNKFDIELGIQKEEIVYSTLKKYIILFIVAFAAILAPLASTVYFPSLQAIREELKTTDQLIDITISVYMLSLGLFPLLWGGLADRFGRKGVFLTSQVIFTLGNIGCALANSIEALIILRVIQGIGASAPIVTGVGTITDIFGSEERGFATSVFFVGPLVGPVVGPIIGGFLFDAFGWRSTFWTLTILGGILLVMSILLLPETLPNRLKQPFPIQINLKPFKVGRGGPLFNPLSPLTFLKYPIVVLACACIALTFGSFFAIESSMSRVFPETYPLTPSQSGLTFIPLGIGSIIGNLVGGKITDISYRRYQRKHSTLAPPPEVRLYGLWLGSFIEVCGLLMTGWFVHYSLPLPAALVATFLIGFGNTSSVIGCSSYLVDHFPNHASSIAACFAAAQLIFTAILTAVNLLILEGLGYPWGISLYALLCLIVCFTVVFLIYFGAKLRSKTGPKLN